MKRREAGFSIVELLIVMVIIGFVLAAGSDMFISALRGYRQQNAIAENKVEEVIGLEMLRRDIESAGYGLPWQMNGISYSEAINATAALYNDSPSNPPRGLLCGNDITSDSDLVKGADYLVIKAVNLARNDACTKWTHLLTSGLTTSTGSESADLYNSDRIIIISPGDTNSATRRTLIEPVSYGTGTPLKKEDLNSGHAEGETRIVYGVAPENSEDSAQPLWMPFNRADYRVKRRDIIIPDRCAAGTGVLVKSIVQQANGGFYSALPILDCVADMQVITQTDMDGDGQWETCNGFTASDAETVRNQLHEVHVYILTHEGQRDIGYAHPKSVMHVGDPGYGRDFDFTVSGIENWQNYRWKIYTLIVKPLNLREANYD